MATFSNPGLRTASSSGYGQLQAVLSQIQQQEALKQERSRADAQRQQDLQREAFAQMMRDPKGFAAATATNPGMSYGVNAPAPRAPTQDEAYHAQVVAKAQEMFPNLPPSVHQQIAARLASGADLSPETVKLLNAQDVTGNKQNWSPEVQQRQAIEDKRSLDANQQTAANQDVRDYTTLQLPKNKAEIAHLGAQTDEQRAAAGNQRAQTAKTQAEAVGAQNNAARLATVTADPSKASATARMLAAYKLDPQTLNRMKPDLKDALIAEALVVNPNLDLTNYQANAQTRADFAKGAAGKNIRSLNTMVEHLGEWADVMGRMGNKGSPAYNAIGNFFSEQGGSGLPAAVQVKANTLAGEYAALLKGGVPDKAEVEQMRQSLAASSSPEKQKEVVAAIARAAIERAAALTNQRRAVELPDDQPILSDVARKTLARLGHDPASVIPDMQWPPERASTPANPSGRPAAQAAGPPNAGPKHYKQTATNPQTGQKIGTVDGVNWEPIP